MLKRITLLLFLCSSLLGFAQVYQLPNGGFEQWESVGSSEEPVNWNSFVTASGTWASMASNQISASTETRPGSSGTKSIRTNARNVLFGIIANGMFTTGQVNMGSTTPSDPANHNITRRATPAFNQPFNGKPDSMVFWAKFVCPSNTQEARMNAVIHDDYDYRDPDSGDPNAASHIVGKATLNFTTGAGAWTKYTVPFDYNFPATSQQYILITFATNAISGSGSSSDVLYVDDIEFVYNAYLADIKIDGNTIQGFNSANFNYFYNADCNLSSVPNITATAVSPNATVNISQATFENPTATVTVSAGNITNTYEIEFTFPTSTSSLLNDEICQGEGYLFNGFNIPDQNTAGTFNFNRTIQNAQGCDSTINLVLTVHPKYEYSTSISICENQLPFQFGGQIFDEVGIYPINLETVHGCDSLITLTLTVGNEYTETLNPNICEGQYFTFMDTIYTETNVYTHIITSPEGCDSIYTINLTVYPNYEIDLLDTIMVGESYIQNGFNIPIQTEVGTFEYQLNLSTIYGCDSIIYLSLTVLNKDAINEFDLAETVNIYPNPVKELFTVEYENIIYQTEIYDITGKLVKSIIKIENPISVQELNSGIYVVRIVTNKGIVMKKLIIQ